MGRLSEAKDPERNEAQRSEVEGVPVEGVNPELVEGGPALSEVEGGWFVYILECRGRWLYVGMTNNLIRRWSEHKRGGARFTKGYSPICVIHVEAFGVRADAEKRERQLKGWTRRKKLALARGDISLLKKL